MSATLSPVSRLAPSTVSGKIQPSHLKRLAVVYVRQSTLQQVERHQESTRLQYALKDRAIDLGWASDQVLVIDEDLGRSGASAEGRPGFQRLVAEVGLDHIGLVLGIEISRLARSSRDWFNCSRSVRCSPPPLIGCLLPTLDTAVTARPGSTDKRSQKFR